MGPPWRPIDSQGGGNQEINGVKTAFTFGEVCAANRFITVIFEESANVLSEHPTYSRGCATNTVLALVRRSKFQDPEIPFSHPPNTQIKTYGHSRVAQFWTLD